MAIAVQSEGPQKYMPLDELMKTVEYGNLSPKMATWVRTYLQEFIESGKFDPLKATRASYECSTEESSRTLGYQLLSNPKIILVLNRFFGDTPEQSFLRQVERAIFNRKLTVAQVRALELLCRVNGWANGIHTADIKSSEPEVKDSPLSAEEPSKPREVPPDALEVWSDPNTGVVIGYRDASGEAVKL